MQYVTAVTGAASRGTGTDVAGTVQLSRAAAPVPVNGVYLSGLHHLLWLNGCWNVERAYPRRHVKELSHKRMKRKKILIKKKRKDWEAVWSGTQPGRQVKTKGAYARRITDKSQTARQAIPAGSVSPDADTTEPWEKMEENETYMFHSLSNKHFLAFTESLVWTVHTFCVGVCSVFPMYVCVWVIVEWPHPSWAVDLAGPEYLASVSLPVPERAAHITSLFVPNVTPSKGEKVIPSLLLLPFSSVFLCSSVPKILNITDDFYCHWVKKQPTGSFWLHCS